MLDFIFTGLCSQEEERLVRDLFRGYNKLIRPVQNMTQKVEVAFGLAFIQLINVVSIKAENEQSSFSFSVLGKRKTQTESKLSKRLGHIYISKAESRELFVTTIMRETFHLLFAKH